MTTFLVAGAVAGVVLFAPGAVVGRIAGLRGLALAALAPALSLAVVGCAALAAPWAGLRWSWWALAGGTALASGFAYLVGRFFPLVTAPRALPRWSARQWALAGGAGLGAAAWALASALIGMGSPGAIGQRRDLVLHYNLVQLIRQTGDASPFAMDVNHFPDVGTAYYPAAVHAAAGLIPRGVDVFAALNVTALAAETTVWTLGVLYLMRVLFPAEPRLAVVGAVLAAVFQSTPSALVLQVPYAVGAALLPALLGWSVQIARLIRERSGGVVGRLLVLAVALAGLGLAHPIAVFSYLLLASPVAGYILVTLTARGWRRGWRAGTIACVTGVAALAGLAVAAALSLPELQQVMQVRSPQEAVNPALALAGGLADSTSNFQNAPNAFAAVAVIAGLAVIWRDRHHRWLIASFAAVDCVYAAAAAQLGFMTWLTGLWYVDRARLGVALTVIALPLAAVGSARLWDRFGPPMWAARARPAGWPGTRDRAALAGLPGSARPSGRPTSASPPGGDVPTGPARPGAGDRAALAGAPGSARSSGPARPARQARPGGRGRGLVAAGLVACLAATAAVMAVRPGRFKAYAFALDQGPERPRFLSAAEIDMVKRLPAKTEADRLILGDPNTGEALVYALTGREVVFGAVDGAWNAPRRYLLEHFPQINEDPKVCDALRQLKVGYLYADSTVYYNSTEFASLTKGLDLTQSFEELDAGGTARLYRISACGDV
ncbi:MAG: hypothetical protein LBC97_07305 [Bifidobacteriaceae bacterium]|nr:hypothetical protein [Bifidobacteriaceae bacterium]